MAEHFLPTVRATLAQWRQTERDEIRELLAQHSQQEAAAREQARAEFLNITAQARAREEEHHAEVMRTMQALRENMANLERRQNNLEGYLGGLTIRLNAVAAAVFPTPDGEQLDWQWPPQDNRAAPGEQQGEAEVQSGPAELPAGETQEGEHDEGGRGGSSEQDVDGLRSEVGDDAPATSVTLPSDASSGPQPSAAGGSLFMPGSSEASPSPVPIPPPRWGPARRSLVVYSPSGSERGSDDEEAPMHVD